MRKTEVCPDWQARWNEYDKSFSGTDRRDADASSKIGHLAIFVAAMTKRDAAQWADVLTMLDPACSTGTVHAFVQWKSGKLDLDNGVTLGRKWNTRQSATRGLKQLADFFAFVATNAQHPTERETCQRIVGGLLGYVPHLD